MASIVARGDRWQIQWMSWDHKRASRTVPGSYADAKAIAASLETEAARIRAGVSLPGSDRTVGEWVKEFLAARQTCDAKRERSYFRRHVLPQFQDRKLDSIEPIEVERWLRWLFAKKLSATSVRNIAVYFRVAYNRARGLGLCKKNPFDGVQLPEANVRAVQVLTPEEVRAILALPRSTLADYAAVLVCACRDGEARALRWECVRWQDHYLVIARQARGGGGAGGPDRRTKGKEVHHAPLPEVLAKILRERWERAGRPEMGWVFPGSRQRAGDSMGRVNYDSFQALMRQAGIARHVWPHLLRHTSNSAIVAVLGLEHGQRALGHADRRTTEKYTHLSPDLFARPSADALDAYVARPRQTELFAGPVVNRALTPSAASAAAASAPQDHSGKAPF